MEKVMSISYEELSNEEKFNYLIHILQAENGEVYGKVVGISKSGKVLYVAPYGANGKLANVFLDERKGWGIQALKKDDDIDVGDYVIGRLVLLSKVGPSLDELEKLESFETFRQKLVALLKEKWQREGFRFSEKEIVKYDGNMAFQTWISEKVEAMLEKQIQQREEQLKGLNTVIKRKEDELEEANSNCIKKSQELRKLKKENKEAKALQLHYEELGVFSLEEKVIEDKKFYVDDIKHKKCNNCDDKSFCEECNSKCVGCEYESCCICDYFKGETFEELIKEAWTYLWKKKHLYYEETTVRYFMNALRTQQLILLWGRPGTGKTSLPRAVADAIGAKCTCIQVQSNWTDNQDILGFYNIVDKRYVATPFLDALIEAEKNPKQLYIILLDEMNLSNIEYYFSEMLNTFTWNEPYKLQLYSKRLRKNVQDDLKMAELQKKDTSRFVSILADMNIYKPEFTIPSNVRFVGTLNSDATTKTISPKVIDRSCLIEMQRISRQVKEEQQKDLLDLEDMILDGNEMVVDSKLFEIFDVHKYEDDTEQTEEDTELKLQIEKIGDILSEAGIFLSNRLDYYVEQWISWGDYGVELDEIVLAKILPMIDLENTSEHREVLMELEAFLRQHDCKKSKQKLLTMMKDGTKRKKRIIYWED